MGTSACIDGKELPIERVASKGQDPFKSDSKCSNLTYLMSCAPKVLCVIGSLFLCIASLPLETCIGSSEKCHLVLRLIDAVKEFRLLVMACRSSSQLFSTSAYTLSALLVSHAYHVDHPCA